MIYSGSLVNILLAIGLSQSGAVKVEAANGRLALFVLLLMLPLMVRISHARYGFIMLFGHLHFRRIFKHIY